MAFTRKSLEEQKRVLEFLKQAGVNTEYKEANHENRRDEYYYRFAQAQSYAEKKQIAEEMRHTMGTVPVDFQLELEALKPKTR